MFRVYLLTILAIASSAQEYDDYYEGSTSLEDLPESKLEANIILTNQSGETNITCIATCNPEPSVTWNGKNISNATVTTIKNSNDTVTVKSTISPMEFERPRQFFLRCVRFNMETIRDNIFAYMIIYIFSNFDVTTYFHLSPTLVIFPILLVIIILYVLYYEQNQIEENHQDMLEQPLLENQITQ
ncbi:glycoprotein vOX2-3 [Elephant endotheliotropic herpesvirus 5B]|nr:glycoprotein vOX2-3v3 [Elephant endotheliotropic herpesvirus 5B]UVZ35213.1 glycoprotein vOX2-3 [Elephant endotheliotropic herpesvirus 5B]